MKSFLKLRLSGIAVAAIAALAIGVLPALGDGVGTSIGTNISTSGTLNVDSDTTLNAYTNNLDVSSASLFVNSANQRVGVGTTSPAALLDVVNPTHGTGTPSFRVYNSDYEDTIFSIQSKGRARLNNYDDYNGAGAALTLNQYGSDAGDGLYVEQHGTGSGSGAAVEVVQDNSDNPAMLVNGGFVGIGTDEPNAILEVNSSTHGTGTPTFMVYNSGYGEDIFSLQSKGRGQLNAYDDYSGAGPALSINQYGAQAGDGLYVEQHGTGSGSGAALELVQDNSSQPALLANGQIKSTLSTGTAPFAVSSTTPVANLTAAPTTYDNSGNQLVDAHIVTGSGTLDGSGTFTVTLSNASVFDSTNAYKCTATDTSSAAPIQVVQNSGSSITFNGAITDEFNYICIGANAGP